MAVENARRLRRNLTEAERKLWHALRSRQFEGFKFRRQHPLGPYILDFFCEAEKLAIELDGGQHASTTAADARRTAWLEARGCRVLRFWNNDVLSNLAGVLTTIGLELTASPHPRAGARRPLPSGEG